MRKGFKAFVLKIKSLCCCTTSNSAVEQRQTVTAIDDPLRLPIEESPSPPAQTFADLGPGFEGTMQTRKKGNPSIHDEQNGPRHTEEPIGAITPMIEQPRLSETPYHSSAAIPTNLTHSDMPEQQSKSVMNLPTMVLAESTPSATVQPSKPNILHYDSKFVPNGEFEDCGPSMGPRVDPEPSHTSLILQDQQTRNHPLTKRRSTRLEKRQINDHFTQVQVEIPVHIAPTAGPSEPGAHAVSDKGDHVKGDVLGQLLSSRISPKIAARLRNGNVISTPISWIQDLPNRKISPKAKLLLDDLPKWLDDHPVHDDRNQVITLMQNLCIGLDALPARLILDGVVISTYPVDGDEKGDTHSGMYLNRPVALKFLRGLHHGAKKDGDLVARIRQFYREAIVLYYLDHANVAKLLGIYAHACKEGEAQDLFMVSPAEDNVPLLRYLQANTIPTMRDRISLIHEIAAGLNYLHSKSIVHGDLHWNNIFINKAGHPLLANYGLSNILSVDRRASKYEDGVTGWLAPELLQGGHQSQFGDVYAFGCIAYLIWGNYLPYDGNASPTVVMRIVFNNERPERPTDIKGVAMPDALWEIVLRCFSEAPELRPKMGEVAEMLARLRKSA